MTRIIYVVYIKEYLTSRQIIGANLKNIDMKDLMILQMMQGSNDGQMNPMFMMAMMDKGGNNSMIETMLMMQMMGNNQMSFPFMPNQSQKEEK